MCFIYLDKRTVGIDVGILDDHLHHGSTDLIPLLVHGEINDVVQNDARISWCGIGTKLLNTLVVDLLSQNVEAVDNLHGVKIGENKGPNKLQIISEHRNIFVVDLHGLDQGFCNPVIHRVRRDHRQFSR